MGTWDTGPFDNDTAADFALALDDAEPEERESMVRGVLARTVDDDSGFLMEADQTVAAAALIAAQCPGGEPAEALPYGPRASMPAFPPALRVLADEALARVVDFESGPEGKWVDPAAWRRWRATVQRLRAVLAPPPPTIPLFDLEP
ncbi:DUF4259 domain-containing protein [Streptomyces sp.]|uniref:DUF4259 domain-containing protein n=1 Tax=Streptomyces sp. TaxID=1931 RepID=UPI002F9341CF